MRKDAKIDNRRHGVACMTEPFYHSQMYNKFLPENCTLFSLPRTCFPTADGRLLQSTTASRARAFIVCNLSLGSGKMPRVLVYCVLVTSLKP